MGLNWPLIVSVIAMGSAPAEHPSVPVELDHIWLVVSPGAPERVTLERAGFRVAPQVNRHEGQGTASVTVEFDNSFLELLWPDDSVRVSPGSEIAAYKFRRKMAWKTSGWSPIGIGLRRTLTSPDSLPFPTWPITAQWMRPGEALAMLTPRADSLGPSVWVVPRSMAVSEDSVARAVRADSAQAWTHAHPIGVHRLTAVQVTAPTRGLTPVTQVVNHLGAARFEPGEHWLLELTFDNGARHLTKDLRPGLPLVIRY
jgi:hypothetical protein